WRLRRRDEKIYALPFPRSWIAILIAGGIFAVFLLPFGMILDASSFDSSGDLFDLVFLLFSLFWLLGWSVGTLLLLVVFLALTFARETLRIRPGYVTVWTHVLGLGFGIEFKAQGIRNPRTEEPVALSGDDWRGRHLGFDYAEETVKLGSAMSDERAYRIISDIREIAQIDTNEEDYAEFRRVQADAVRELAEDKQRSSNEIAAQAITRPETSSTPTTISSISTRVLIAANLVPLLGVWLYDWSIGEIMLLFWAESAVVGFYNLLKMWVIGRWAVLIMGPFFVGHFGGFMVAHLLFIYGFFQMGPDDGFASTAQVIADFRVLWPALLAIFLSHGISFRLNFIGRLEYQGRKIGDQMSEPYRRIIIMHLTIILGGFLTFAFDSPLPALILLILLKIMVDVKAHLKEHGAVIEAKNGSQQA
ncbi:MAG: DUF6498-containing protein, partial [Pseudohongiellaceae bacterium]